MSVYRLRGGRCCSLRAPARILIGGESVLSLSTADAAEPTPTACTSRARSSSPSSGRGRVSPNPLVGAVIARDGEVLGEGLHAALGGPHAEVEAIDAAADADLAGATLYVSLEPCCHHGQARRRAPTRSSRPASRRVVVASDDPTEQASGRGLGILRDEGIEVVVADGELAARARLLNQPFRKHARTGRPWVLFKSAMTLDGKVATAHRRLEVDLRRGEPPARRTAGAPSATRSRSASAPRWPTTRS